MSKRIIIVAIVVLIGAFIFWQKNSVKTSYVNGLPEYTNLPGKEYIFERDCYIFKFKKHNTTYPLVGANAPDLSLSVPDLPKDVRSEEVGKDLPAVRILDVVKSGSRFKIVSVRRDQSPKHTDITLEILFMDEADRKYPRLDAFYLLDHTPEQQGQAPRLIDGYAVERIKK